jgi:HEPN domain-containing protein
MNQLTREWVAKAEGDFVMAETLLASRRIRLADGVAFHCQQSIEKYLKARLQEAGLPVERTHDLVKLVDQLKGIEPLWQSFRVAFNDINDYAVHFRYPGQSATKAEARKAFKTTVVFRSEARHALGLK